MPRYARAWRERSQLAQEQPRCCDTHKNCCGILIKGSIMIPLILFALFGALILALRFADNIWYVPVALGTSNKSSSSDSGPMLLHVSQLYSSGLLRDYWLSMRQRRLAGAWFGFGFSLRLGSSAHGVRRCRKCWCLQMLERVAGLVYKVDISPNTITRLSS